MTAERGGSAPDAARQPGWFARLPLWVRIAAPIVLVVLLAVVVGAIVWGTSRPSDTEQAAEAACRTAAEAQLDRRGERNVELSRSFDVTPQADGAYRIQGTVTFDDDEDETHHADVRCVVRVTADATDVVSVRFND